jgi:hypothetical protein
VDYKSYSRAQAEVMVDTITLLAASSVGLAVDGESVPYVAGWGEDGALQAVTEFADTIDKIAKRIEDVLLAAGGGGGVCVADEIAAREAPGLLSGVHGCAG